jgi:methyl-accepting chemotaxis protein
MKTKNYKRKILNIGVKKEFQRWLLTRIFGSVVMSGLIAAVILYFYSHKELGDSFYAAHITVRHVSDLLLPVILAGSAVSLVSGMFLALFLPQKIAGPLYRIEQDLERVGEGDLTVQVTLREGDTLKDFAKVVNYNIDELRQKLNRIKSELDGIDPQNLSSEQQEALKNLADIKV